MLDQNQLAEGHEFCSVSAFSISPDQNKLAYSLDIEGSEVYTIYVKDLTTGKLYPEKIENVSGSVYYSIGVEWAKDSQTIFYVTLDEMRAADAVLKGAKAELLGVTRAYVGPRVNLFAGAITAATASVIRTPAPARHRRRCGCRLRAG